MIKGFFLTYIAFLMFFFSNGNFHDMDDLRQQFDESVILENENNSKI